MKKNTIVLILILININFVNAQTQRSFLSYYETSDFMQASDGAFKFGLYGFNNPSITNYLHDNDLSMTLADQNQKTEFNRWGLFYGTSNMGLGLIHQYVQGHSVTDYRLSLSTGSNNFGFGVGFGFVGGDKGFFNRSNTLSLGALYRPLQQLSVGLTQTFALTGNNKETVAEIGIRPIGTYPLTFFADYSIFNDQNLQAGNWSGGVSWEIVNGIRVNFRSFKSKAITLGFDLSFGNMGLATIANFDNDRKYSYNSYTIRLGAKDRTIIKDIVKLKNFVKMDLKGAIKYQKFAMFDNSLTLMDILKTLDLIKNDNSIEGIAINVSGMVANKEILWEIRDKLKELKNAGKKIVVFFDRVGIQSYHFASVADKIIMDPMGQVSLEGYILGRSFYKNLLAKINVGFDELRYFKYKSAAESFARDKMSDADREQRQKLVDDWYALTSKEVCADRKLTPAKFDSLVKTDLMYLPDKAKENGLIDTVGRWLDIDEILKNDYGKIDVFIPFNNILNKNEPYDDRWSDWKKNIAVVYAIGVCDMETGIEARKLSGIMDALVKDNSIKAIVLRVDSPGGDAMASDYIADIMRQYKDKKPIIVSQGAVAASGGYWLSMYARKIVASPLTITGSIGVIGEFFYDKGLKDSLGISTDFVKAGEYADVGYPFTEPLFGIPLLPIRDLNKNEKTQIESNIKGMYKDFVNKVAAGRNKKAEDIDSIAQGRVWSGMDGKQNGLVDELGGLWKAIEIAKDEAKINKDEAIDIFEYPKPGFIDLSSILTSLIGINVKEVSTKFDEIKFRLKNNSVPMPMMSLDYGE